MPQHFILREKGPNFNQIVSWGVYEESSCSGEGVPPLRRESVAIVLYKQQGQDALATKQGQDALATEYQQGILTTFHIRVSHA